MSARKRWQTRWPTSRIHPSRASAYRRIHSLAHDRHEGFALVPRHLAVWVDVGHGQGWELYERIDLDALKVSL